MLVLRRFLIWLLVILTAAVYELQLLKPDYFVFWAAIIVLLTLVGIYLIYNAKTVGKKDLLLFSVSPLLLTIGTFTFLFFLENLIVIQLIIVCSSFFLSTYFDNFFFFSKVPFLYQPFSLEAISSFISIYSLFLITASLTAVRIFLNIGLEILGPIFILIIFLFLGQSFWINKFGLRQHWHYPLVIALLIGETALALDFLAFDYFVKAILIASVYYFLTNVSLFKLKNTLNKNRFLFNLSLLMIIWLLTTFTTRWL